MEIASAPTTPENSGSPHVLRRSFTAPIRSTGFSKVTEPFRETEGEGAETLFTHSAGRIVSFNAYPSVVRRRSNLGHGILDKQEEPVGSLPWVSTTERTIAAGSTLSVQYIFVLTYLIPCGFVRTITNLPSAWLCGISALRNNAPTYTGKVAVLVR